MKKGYAYREDDGSVYFSIEKFPGTAGSPGSSRPR